MGSGDDPGLLRPGSEHPAPRVGTYLYPWDLLGDPDAVPRLLAAGLEQVRVAAAYHSVRAATPPHPRHRFVLAETSALYRPLREAAWAASFSVPGALIGRGGTTRSTAPWPPSTRAASASAPGSS